MTLAGRPFEMERTCYEQIKFISPNLDELRKIAETLKISPSYESDLKVENVRSTEEKRKLFREITELCDALQEHTENIIVTAGSLGVFIQRSRGSEASFFTRDMRYIANGNVGKSCRHFPGKTIEKIVNASGAGDAFCAGFITAMLTRKPEAICVSVGFQAATCALMSKRAVPEEFFGPDHDCWETPADFHDLKLH